MKKFFKLFNIVALILLVSGCGENKNNDLAEYLSYDNASYYTKYLVSVDGDRNDIDLFYTDKEDGKYLIQVINGSDYFFKGEIEMYDDDKNIIGNYKIENLIDPGNNVRDYVTLDGDLSLFYVNNPVFYKFNYPNIDSSYDLYSDTIDEKYIYDALLGDNCNVENAKTVAKYEYAAGVILDYMVQDIYFYDSNVIYYTYTQDEEEYKYPDTSSAVYKATYDYNDKKISFYELIDENWNQTDTFTMN